MEIRTSKMMVMVKIHLEMRKGWRSIPSKSAGPSVAKSLLSLSSLVWSFRNSRRATIPSCSVPPIIRGMEDREEGSDHTWGGGRWWR